MTLLDRIMRRVDAPTLTGCWAWRGATVRSRSGARYGKIRWGRRTLGFALTHRAVYTVLVGDPAGELDHLCRNTLCCNPAHLEDVSHVVNAQRRDAAHDEPVLVYADDDLDAELYA